MSLNIVAVWSRPIVAPNLWAPCHESDSQMSLCSLDTRA